MSGHTDLVSYRKGALQVSHPVLTFSVAWWGCLLAEMQYIASTWTDTSGTASNKQDWYKSAIHSLAPWGQLNVQPPVPSSVDWKLKSYNIWKRIGLLQNGFAPFLALV